MNRLLTKKGRDEGERSVTPQPDASKSRGFWGKKKQLPEPEPRFDLNSVLPASDNFRTSLIMPGLSARFSMLKEANDPYSKIGKANDDSMINRRSRHFGGLGDIDEVASIADSFRPPFASQRSGSYHSEGGYATDDDSSIHSGSIMSRARPGEGNMLFGGRQKIYRIPIGDAGSVNNLGAGDSRGMRGRALYEDDISMSAFQRLREKEKQEQRAAKLAEAEREAEMEVSKPYSPATSTFEEKRHTTSSTNSGPSMISASTAATSITSPGYSPLTSSPAPPVAAATAAAAAQSRPSLDKSRPSLDKSKSRRLYEQGLDQHLQEQQTANLTRLNSVARKNNAPRPTPQLNGSKSTSSLRERFERAAADGINLNQLPSTEGLTTFESLRKANPKGFSTTRPKNDSDAETVFVQSLDQRDRGKATALGAFNKPKPFDEEQFMARQQSLERTRSKRSNSATNVSRAITDRSILPRTSGESSGRPSIENRFRSHGRPQSPALEPRNPSTSSFGTRLRSDSDKTSKPGTPTSPLAAESFEDQADFSKASSKTTQPKSEPSTVSSPPPSLAHTRTGATPAPLFSSPSKAPLLEDHPAMRQPQSPTSPTASLKERRQGWAPGKITPAFQEIAAAQTSIDESVSGSNKPSMDVEAGRTDTPTLRGIVSQHLRHGSDQSSIYHSRESKYVQEDNPAFDLRIPSMYDSQSNPWDIEEFTLPPYKPTPPRVVTEPAPQQDATQKSANATSNVQRESLLNSALADENFDWRRELEKHHNRAESSETQAEKDAFADELAQRQRAIQENLRVKAGLDKDRSPSPTPNKTNVFESSLKPFGLLRTRSSRESLPKPDSKPKRSPIGRLPNESSSSLEKGTRDNGDSSKPVIGRTLHSRLPRTSEDSSQRSRDHSRRRQNSVASTHATSTSPHETPDQSSRTSTSHDAVSEGKQKSSIAVSSPSEVSSQRDYGYFEARNPLNQYGHRSLEPQNVAESNNFPFEKSGDIVEASRVRSDGSQLSQKTTTRRMPPLVTNSDPPRSAAMSEPYSANSTPPLSTTSTPSLRGDTIPSLAQVAAMSRKSPDLETFNPANFQFPARQTEPSRKSSRHRGSPAVTKADISEPQFISATSTVDTVALPPGASLQNGMKTDVDAVLAASHSGFPQGIVRSTATLPSPSDTVPIIDPQTRSQPQPRTDGGPGNISVTHMPPPTPSAPTSANGSFRKGFFKFGNKKQQQPESPEEDDDDFFTRAGGGRLRIKKVSNDNVNTAGRPRHRIVGAAEMENSGFI